LYFLFLLQKLVYHASKVEEIYREAQALKKLAHPNIVTLYNAFLMKNYLILIMENVAGGELRKYINEKGGGNGISEIEAREFFIQILEAVDYFHSKGVVHRDLKPENILLTDAESKKIKMIDFGIARDTDCQPKSTEIIGSLHYMAPETIMGKSTNDPSIDVWSMGIILYVLVYGKFPFRGKNADEVKKSICGHKLQFRTKKVTEECKKLITEMLQKEHSKRIKTTEIFHSQWLNIPYFYYILHLLIVMKN